MQQTTHTPHVFLHMCSRKTIHIRLQFLGGHEENALKRKRDERIPTIQDLNTRSPTDIKIHWLFWLNHCVHSFWEHSLHGHRTSCPVTYRETQKLGQSRNTELGMFIFISLFHHSQTLTTSWIQSRGCSALCCVYSSLLYLCLLPEHIRRWSFLNLRPMDHLVTKCVQTDQYSIWD